MFKCEIGILLKRRHTMSGPKTSNYVIIAQQRANILEQNRCDSEILSCIDQVKKCFSLVTAELEKIELYEGIGGDGNKERTTQIMEDIKRIERKKAKLSASFFGMSSYKRSTKVTPSDRALAQKKSILENIKSIKKDIKSILKEVEEIRKSADKLHNDISAELERNAGDAFGLSWDLTVEEIQNEVVRKSEKGDITKLKTICINQINPLLSYELPNDLQERANQAIRQINEISDILFLRNFKAITLKLLENDCAKYFECRNRIGEKFEDLKSRYISLCKMQNVVCKNYELSEENCKELEKEIDFLEKQLYEDDEQKYIADTIDEVMKEMGYDLIGSREVTKRSGKRFRDELYTFSEGTAVNIRYDNQGKIAMELGGIDSTDRLPSPSEASKLEDEMVAFCDKFTEFERRLAAKGIVCKNRVSHLPPKAEYAQIINTSDYDVKKEVETFKTEHRSTKNESKKQHRNE